jgi:putative flippase GtrA
MRLNSKLVAPEVGKDAHKVRDPSLANGLSGKGESWRDICWRWVRYGLTGGANTLLDIAVLNLLLWRFPLHSPQSLVIYNSIAYASGAASSFFLNKYWTFRRTQRPARKEIVCFLLSLALEMFSSNVFVSLAGLALAPLISNVTLWSNAAKLLAVAGNTLVSYALMRYWTFAER